jgi:hypothetical protein
LHLTELGRIILWLVASLLVIGFFFLNPLILIIGAVSIALFLVEAVSFRRAVGIARRSITVHTEPTNVETSTGRPAQAKTTIRNSSQLTFRISSIKRIHAPEIQMILDGPKSILRRGEQKTKVLFKSDTPGRYETQGTVLCVIAGRGFFKQSLQFSDRVKVTNYPLPRGIDTLSSATDIFDLAIDTLRRGTGTDLAGFRPYSFLDDFHRIDWKATARTGQLIARDFYAEKDPTIMLLIDISALKQAMTAAGAAIMLTQFMNLFSDPFIAMSPIGMVMFDQRSVVAHLDPQVGPEGRTRLRHMLFEKIDYDVDLSGQLGDSSRSYVELVRNRQALVAHSTREGRGNPFGDLVQSLASKVLPFYDVAISTHLLRVKGQGAFKAFEIIATLTEPTLTVCLASRNTKASGLYEGARLAATLNHRVVLALIDPHEYAEESADQFRGLTNLGVRLVTTTPDRLWRTVNKELEASGQRRAIAGRSLG